MATAADKPHHRSDGRGGLIGLFSHHPVASNLLMVIMLLAGFWAIKQLNTQVLPNFDLDYVMVRTTWSGASAEEVEELITVPLEQSLRDVDYIKNITSSSADGVSNIALEFYPKTEMGLATDQVKQNADQVRNLPADSDQPTVNKITRYEAVARLLVTGPNDVNELRTLVNRFETELLEQGIAKLFISGLPKQKIAIEIPAKRLRELGLSLDDIGRRVEAGSQDAPMGVIGRGETSRQLRFQERRKTERAFASIPIVAEQQGRLITLGSIAEINRKPLDGQVSISYRGKPAVELSLNRTSNSDSLESAQIFHQWLEQTRLDLPAGVELIDFDARWELVRDRIELMIKNGLTGLLLVVLILFFFMNGRVAWWVAVGIPVSFMAALAILYFIGGSINMLSLFALIMALGIIVDDAIVVGENAMAQFENGVKPERSAELAARQMLGPVCSSSLTTVCAFLPLMLVGSVIGTIMRDIPIVVICVILASLIECFLVMPGHLTHSFSRLQQRKKSRLRHRLDNGFNRFRDGIFRKTLTVALDFRWTTLAIALTVLVVTVAWFSSGRINFKFFPTAEGDRIYANIGFVSGTSAERVNRYLELAERKLIETQQELGEEFVDLIMLRHGATTGDDDETGSGSRGSKSGDHFGSIQVELVDPDRRGIRNHQITRAWQDKLPRWPGIETLSISEPRVGPPGSDIDIGITAGNIDQAKQAALALQDALIDIPGVIGVGDNAPYGREQLVLKLTPTAEVLGLGVGAIARQLRAAYDGYQVQELSDGFDDIDITVQLPDHERNTLTSLSALDIVLPNGRTETIGNLVTIDFDRGFENIRHNNGRLTIKVVGQVDPAVNSANLISRQLRQDILPDLASRYGVQFDLEGRRQADRSETLKDMRLGLVIALTLIYLVLAWVFGSYGWPLLVMIIIPFGLVGAIWGHVFMQHDVTLLSLFGFFGLSGIVVNDSIILLVFYKKLRQQGMPYRMAVVEATCQRLRALILTSLTTIGGLLPLLFETSLQAQFLIPMAISLAFGLGFATVLVLFLLPCLLVVYERTADFFAGRTEPVTEPTPVEPNAAI